MTDDRMLEEDELYDWAADTVEAWTPYERRIVRLALNAFLPDDGGSPHHAGTVSHRPVWFSGVRR